MPLLLLQLADGMATRGPTYRREHFERHIAFLGHIVTRTAEALREEEPALVDGEELMRELGLLKWTASRGCPNIGARGSAGW